eukprot:scaffold83168_cov60-Phaeocystis_antarctica.AAC.4
MFKALTGYSQQSGTQSRLDVSTHPREPPVGGAGERGGISSQVLGVIAGKAIAHSDSRSVRDQVGQSYRTS